MIKLLIWTGGWHMENTKYLIIGNGITGLSAAEEIRKADPDGRIIICSDEELSTYYRMKLSHFISRQFEEGELLLHEDNWYEERRIELLLGKRVSTINFESKTVFADDVELRYEKLLLANGSHPFVPYAEGLDTRGVFSLRSVKDLERIQAYIADVDRVAVVGGGILGLEVVQAVHALGKKVQVIEFAPYLMARQLDEALSREFEGKLVAEGIEMFLGAGAKIIDGNERVERILLTDGRELHTQAVIFSCGIRSNIDLFKGTSLAVERGVVVNNRLETSVADVYAAGDVAQVDGFTLGLWTAGMAQGKIAGKNMAGLAAEYLLEMPSTMFQFNEEKIFSTGKIGDDFSTLESKTGRGKLKLFFDNGKLTGAVLLNDSKYIMQLKKEVGQETDCSQWLESGLSAVEIMEELKK